MMMQVMLMCVDVCLHNLSHFDYDNDDDDYDDSDDCCYYYFRLQLLDVVAATQTRPAQEALLDLLSFEDEESVEHPERYLFAAAYSTHPSEALIRDLLVWCWYSA